MLMKFPKLIDAIRAVHPEPVDNLSFLNELDRQNPLRVKLIACGFAWKLSEEEMQALLKQQGQQPLYSRNLWEFIIRVAFQYGLTYEEWWAIHKTIMEHQTGWEDQIHPVASSGITMEAVKSYIDGNGGPTFNETTPFTEELNQALKTAQERPGTKELDLSLLETVIQENLEKFAVPRTRTRIYFMRDLHNYMNWVQGLISDAFDAGDIECVKALAGRYFQCKTDKDLAKILKDLSEETALPKKEVLSKRKSLLKNLENKRFVPAALARDFDWFCGCLLSFGIGEAVYTAAENASYFHKQEIAWKIGVNTSSAVILDPDQLKEQLQNTATKQMEKDELDERWAERYFRDLITGKQEISRELLLLFLLFVWCTAGNCERTKLTKDKINLILTRSGFLELQKSNALDDMVLSALKERKELETVGPQLKLVIEESLFGNACDQNLDERKNQSILGQRLKRAVTRDLVEHEHVFLEKMRTSTPLHQAKLAASMTPEEKEKTKDTDNLK